MDSRPEDSQRRDGKPWRQRWDERYSAAEFDPARQPSEFVVAELGGLPPGRALDLGAGSGRHTVWLAERGWRVTAVDFSRAGLALARRLSVSRGVDQAQLDWVVADLGSYEPERGAYDLAMISYVQPSSAVRAAILGRVPAALAPGGTAFALGFDLANLTEGTGRPRQPGRAVHPRGGQRGTIGSAHHPGRTAVLQRPPRRRPGDDRRHPGPRRPRLTPGQPLPGQLGVQGDALGHG